MSTTQGLAEILVAIAQVRDEIGHVAKDGTNAFHHYDYTSEAAISRAVRPMLEKAGLVILQSVATDPAPRIDDCGVTHLVLEYTVAHTSGAVWPEKLRVFASGNDRDSKGLHGDKGAFKANTGGYKYFLNRLFMIDTADGDDTPRQKETASRRQDGANLASEKQLRMLTAKSYARADELTGDGENHELAGSIRKAAMHQLGFTEKEGITFAAVTPMGNAIEKAILDDDGGSSIP